MKITYVAIDGTTFDSREDCVEYEESTGLQFLEGKVRFFNRDGLEIPATEIICERNYDYVYCMEVADLQALQALEKRFYDDAPWSIWGVPTIFPTIWIYTEKIDGWISQESINQLQAELDRRGRR